MNTTWNELTKTEKITQVISIAFATIGFIFAMLDHSKVWEYAHLGWVISFAFFLAAEAKLHWAKARKIAILDLVLCVGLIGVNIVTKLI